MAEEKRSVVYFVEIGNHIKIGFTTNLDQRLRAFMTSNHGVKLLLAIPGDRSTERKFHELFAAARIEREIFRMDPRIINFIEHVEYGGLERGLRFLEATTPAAIARRKAEDRQRRVAVARKTKAERDAHCAALVAERQRRLGW